MATICFDVDGVVAQPNWPHYAGAKPYPFAIEQVNRLYDDGHTIVFLTARYMGLTGQNQQKAKEMGEWELRRWLDRCGFKYHAVFLGKPSADFYVDDRAFQVRSEDGEADWQRLVFELGRRKDGMEKGSCLPT